MKIAFTSLIIHTLCTALASAACTAPTPPNLRQSHEDVKSGNVKSDVDNKRSKEREIEDPERPPMDKTPSTNWLADLAANDGVVSARAFVPKTFEQTSEEEDYRQDYEKCLADLKAASDLSNYQVRYKSGAYTVSGVVAHLKGSVQSPGRKALFVFNRGGNRDFGVIDACNLTEYFAPILRTFAKNNFAVVIVASNYRGNDGESGQEQFGGAEVADIDALVAVMKTFDWIDSNRLFMYGHSRGGMMTHLVSRHSEHQFKAVAVGGGLTNLFLWADEDSQYMDNVFRPLIPPAAEEANFDFGRCFNGSGRSDGADLVDAAGEMAQALANRSATCWPEKLRFPLFIMHGSADQNVNIQQPRLLATQLGALNKTPYQYKVYQGDGHGLFQSWPIVVEDLLKWFKKYGP